MSSISKRVIYVGPADGANHKPICIEGIALSAVLPGTIMKETPTGLDVDDVSLSSWGRQLLIADKNQMQSKSVDDPWVVNESMVVIAPRSGEFCNALVAAGQTLIKGSALERNGDGTLSLKDNPFVGAPSGEDVTNETANHIHAYSDEEITTTEPTLVRIRIA